MASGGCRGRAGRPSGTPAPARPHPHEWGRLPPPPMVGLRGWSVAFSPDGTRLLAVAGGAVRVAKLCDVWTGTVVLELKGLSAFVQSLAFSPDGTRIVIGGA